MSETTTSKSTDTEETVLSADSGNVTVRGCYRAGGIVLGLTEENDPTAPPTVSIRLTDHQTEMLIELLHDYRKHDG
jgi:hypothetical protein